ncbi:flavodoxin domain-containing protein [Streptomyces tuirus]|uniref:flavodoxin domain-containing protein n=1 Tax=Streptomyces tuirus TaxID=68278 RepID=UPI00343F1B18
MNEKVLVAYGSTNGSTAEIAERVGEILAKEGLAVDVLPAADATDLAPYGAVLLGSGLYAGHWQRDARRFARRHRKAREV